MKKAFFDKHMSSMGMDAGMMSIIAYLGASIIGLIPGIKIIAFLVPLILYLIEKDSLLVKFSAMQAFLLDIIAGAISILVSIIVAATSMATIFSSGGASLAGLGFIFVFNLILNLCVLGLSIYLAISANNGNAIYLPLIGNWTASICKMQKM